MKGILIYCLLLLLFVKVKSVEENSKDSQKIKDCKSKCLTLSGEKRTNCEEQCHDDDIEMNGMVVLYAVLIAIPLIIFIGLIFYYYRKRVAKFLGIKLPREELKQHFISSIGTLDNKELKNIRQELKENHWEIIKQSELEQEEGIDLTIWAELSSNKGILNIKMVGVDKVGQWNSKGILVKDINGMQYIWMLVDYVNKKKAGQVDNLKYLIYRAERSPDSNYFIGKWYFNGQDDHEMYSGKLVMKRIDQLKIS